MDSLCQLCLCFLMSVRILDCGEYGPHFLIFLGAVSGCA